MRMPTRLDYIRRGPQAYGASEKCRESPGKRREPYQARRQILIDEKNSFLRREKSRSGFREIGITPEKLTYLEISKGGRQNEF
jgi:hypothetical protein